jgi:hypothetical protein
MKILKKLYFFVILILAVLSFVLAFVHYQHNQLALLLVSVDLFTTVLALYMLYSIVFKKNLLFPGILKFYPLVLIIWDVFDAYLFETKIRRSEIHNLLITFLILLPEYIILLRYSSRNISSKNRINTI